jgi:hypothetical protein
MLIAFNENMITDKKTSRRISKIARVTKVEIKSL